MQTRTVDNSFLFQVREDFSLFVAPIAMGDLQRGEPREDIDRSNTAEKGYILSGRSKRKIKSAVYSLYCRGTRAEQRQLRFVTFTFPPLPEEHETKTVQEQDKFLHSIFKKFLDNERKESNNGINRTKTKLTHYVWVNERQDGKRLEGIVQARNILHYHCLFKYSSPVDYWTCNVRWLNLLHRNGFEIFNSEFLKPEYKELRAKVLHYLKTLQYEELYNIREQLRITVWRGLHGFKEESIFLQPVDFDKKPIEDVDKLGKYLAAYITKDNIELSEEEEDNLKVYARRWCCSRGLVIQKDEVNKQFLQAYPKEITRENTSVGADLEIIDIDTGEILTAPALITLDNESILKLYRLDKKAYAKKFELEVQGKKFECYYFPPQFKLWVQMPDMKQFFKTAFGYNII